MKKALGARPSHGTPCGKASHREIPMGSCTQIQFGSPGLAKTTWPDGAVPIASALWGTSPTATRYGPPR